MPNRRSFLKLAPAVAAPLFADSAVPPLPRPDDPAYWDKIRDQFLLAHDKVFFNTGTIGAMPRVVFERTVDHLRQMATDVADWDYRGENWIGGYDNMNSIRTKAARLMNAGKTELALTENVTAAMSFVASGLDLEPGSEILLSNQEHPGGISPWLNAAKRRKATVKQIELPRPIRNREQVLELVTKSFTPATRVIAISHVITGAGAILPAREICAEARRRGIFTVLDGAQAFGHIPVDVRALDCDVYVGCFHKWILAPAGNGFLYVRRERQKDVWSSIASSQWNNHEDDGYRFTQRGTGSMSLLKGLDAALDFHTAIGPERWHSRIKYLGEYLRTGLRRVPKVKIFSPEDESMCAAITVYGVEGVSGAQLQDEMWKRERLRPRSSGSTGVRHCTHIYNSTAEIDRALRVIKALSA
jgi:selenocysteine lyase/cysteine desulfurase